MRNQHFSQQRRALLAAAGGTALLAGLGLPALAQSRSALALRLAPRMARLATGMAESPIWSIEADAPAIPLRFRKGDDLKVTISNEISAPTILNWFGFNGALAAEALLSQMPTPANATSSFLLPTRHAGTFAVDARLLGDGKERPSSARALIVEDSEPIAVDRDEVMLIEDWRVKPDGRAISPGGDADGTMTAYTVNGLPTLDIALKPNERLRLRIVNACNRAAIGLKIENQDVRVMAIDSQPAEPFLARDGQLVLAPGSRIDAFIDATKPPGTASAIILHDGTAPRAIGRLIVSNDAPVRAAALPVAAAFSSAHLPARLDLQSAVRVDVQLDAKTPWSTPADFSAATPPVVQVKRGRVVVMAITNPTATPTAFRLHGHHFRLLDRLDDGWKPFWLDTLMLDSRQTQRIAFLAEHAGRWLIESAATSWSAPRLLRSYAVA